MANYPSSLSTNSNLYIAVNALQTTLAVTCTSGATTLTLTSTTGFPTTGLVTIDNTEVVSYTGVSGATITGCTRGADGTTAASHLLGVTVGLTVVAAHHNLLKDEVIAIETALGTSLANVFPATPTTGSGNVVLATSPTLVTPNLGTPSAVNLTNATNIPNSATTATPNATASTIMSRDASINTRLNEMVENFSTTVTAAGTTTLTVTSSPLQQFTGTTTQIVKLPDATTLAVGFYFTILNRSTGIITVNNTGSVLQKNVAVATQYIFTCTNVGSANGTWDVSSDAGTGTVTSVSGTANQITSTGGTTPVLALANPLTITGNTTINVVSGNALQIHDTTNTQDSFVLNSTASGFIDFILSANRDPVSGTYSKTGQAASAIQFHSANGAGNASIFASNTNNGTLLQAAKFNNAAGGGAQLTGTTAGDNAAAGITGEYIESVVSNANAAATTTYKDFTSISLTAGDWDITGIGVWTGNGATGITDLELIVSSTSGNSTTGATTGSNWVYTNGLTAGVTNNTVIVPVYRVNLSATTTYYLKGLAAFSSGTPQMAGRLSARRIR